MKGIISKSYGEKTVFEQLSFHFPDGAITCVLGASGVGKTTLLKALGGLTEYDGNIESNARSAFVFQEPRLLPHLTVLENLLYVGATPTSARFAMEKCRILHLENRVAATLSGGEKQRAALARCFCLDADVWLLDEPFVALDTPLKVALWQDFAALWQEKKPTTVLVTHDLEEAWALGHTVVVLKDGKIIYETQPRRDVFPTPYGEHSEEKTKFIQAVFAL